MPEISAITSIGIDHERLLGNTRLEIARDKAGIIKESRPVVIGPTANLEPIIEEARLKNAPLIAVAECGDFEEENNAITRKIIDNLRGKGIKISDSHIEEGLLIRQPCRMEELPKNLLPKWAPNKRVFFDVAHNFHAIVLNCLPRKRCSSTMRKTSKRKETN
jgi:folylpolyglutamate synthase/dihydropteroate synthase